MTFCEHGGGKKQMLTSSKENEEQCGEEPLPNHQRKLLLSNPTTKIYYLPFLFIEYLEFSKLHCNLFNFGIQIILVKVGFYFLLSIVFKKWILMVLFEFFR